MAADQPRDAEPGDLFGRWLAHHERVTEPAASAAPEDAPPAEPPPTASRRLPSPATASSAVQADPVIGARLTAPSARGTRPMPLDPTAEGVDELDREPPADWEPIVMRSVQRRAERAAAKGIAPRHQDGRTRLQRLRDRLAERPEAPDPAESSDVPASPRTFEVSPAIDDAPSGEPARPDAETSSPALHPAPAPAPAQLVPRAVRAFIEAARVDPAPPDRPASSDHAIAVPLDEPATGAVVATDEPEAIGAPRLVDPDDVDTTAADEDVAPRPGSPTATRARLRPRWRDAEPVAASMPGRYVFKPKRTVRRVLTLALLSGLAASALFTHAAWQTEETPSIGLAAIVILATALVWAIRGGSSITRLEVHQGQLEVLQQGSRFVFDMASDYTLVEVHGRPGKRGWKVVFPRRGMTPFTIDASMVDPHEFMRVLRFFRPELRQP